MKLIIPHIKLTVLIFLMVARGAPAICQDSTANRPAPHVVIHGISDTKIHRKFSKKARQISDSDRLMPGIEEWIGEVQRTGLLEFGLDSISYISDTLHLIFRQGPRYVYEAIHLEGMNPLYLEKTGLDKLARRRSHVDWKDLETRLAACLSLLQNDGFPFARLYDRNVRYGQAGQDSINTTIRYQFDAGPLVEIDSILVTGNHREKDQFIYSLTRLYPGNTYNQKLISDVPRILNNSIYFQKVVEPDVKFTSPKTATLSLKLEKKQASKFDVLLGILPPSGNTGKTQFTGTVDIALVSPLKQGELFQFTFNKLTSTSQQTELRLILPYLLRTPLRIETQFSLLKQTEDFLNLNYHLAGLYAFSPFLNARFYLRNRSTRLLDSTLTDTTSLRLAQLDGSNSVLGVGLSYENLDYRWNPSKGISGSLEVGLGRRRIRENVLIKRNRPEFYDSIDPDQPTREVRFSLKGYFSLFPRHVIHLANQTYWLGMENYLRNDQIQVGGSRSIRGFDENAFFTDFYTFFTAEYRLQLERNSYLFLFGDIAYLENNEAGTVRNLTGYGLGMNYGTKAGIISISYAVGRNEDIPFQPSRGKIHIGLINQF